MYMCLYSMRIALIKKEFETTKQTTFQPSLWDAVHHATPVIWIWLGCKVSHIRVGTGRGLFKLRTWLSPAKATRTLQKGTWYCAKWCTESPKRRTAPSTGPSDWGLQTSGTISVGDVCPVWHAACQQNIPCQMWEINSRVYSLSYRKCTEKKISCFSQKRDEN